MSKNYDNFDLKMSLEETKFFLLQQYSSMSVIKKSVQDAITAFGLLLTLLGFFQATIQKLNFTEPSVREWLVLLAIFIYVVLLILHVALLMPTQMETPIKIHEETFEKIYFCKSKKRILENKLYNYIDAVEKNRIILQKALIFSRIVIMCNILSIIIFIISLIFSPESI